MIKSENFWLPQLLFRSCAIMAAELCVATGTRGKMPR